MCIMKTLVLQRFMAFGGGGCKLKTQCLCENYPHHHKVSPCHCESTTRHPESTTRHSEAQAEESIVNKEILQSHSFLQNDDLTRHSERSEESKKRLKQESKKRI